MVSKSLDTLIGMDTKIARDVLTLDDMIDDLNREMYSTVQAIMCENLETIDRAVNILFVSCYLERIAYLSTNIAEDVVFMVKGELTRHKAVDLF
jgi:phosphate transport system protein